MYGFRSPLLLRFFLMISARVLPTSDNSEKGCVDIRSACRHMYTLMPENEAHSRLYIPACSTTSQHADYLSEPCSIKITKYITANTMLKANESLTHTRTICCFLSMFIWPRIVSGVGIEDAEFCLLTHDVGCICNHANVAIEHTTIHPHEAHIKP